MKKTVAPNHKQLLHKKAIGIFGHADVPHEVLGWIDDTTINPQGTVSVSLQVDCVDDVYFEGLWTSRWRLV